MAPGEVLGCQRTTVWVRSNRAIHLVCMALESSPLWLYLFRALRGHRARTGLRVTRQCSTYLMVVF